MKHYIRVLILGLTAMLLSQLDLHAQAPGSEAAYGGSTATVGISTGGTHADVSETLYIGPGSYQIDGTWEIYSKKVIIDPNAILTGSGSIQFYNPSVAGGASSITMIDGNGSNSSVDVNIGVNNASGMSLVNMNYPAELVDEGFTNTTTTSSLYVGKSLSLNVDGANIFLDSVVVGNLRLDTTANIGNFRPQRMIVTNNSILSHVIKEGFTTAFVFPIGIAAGDYTPAEITNVSAVNVSVSVQDYSKSASPENTTDGVNRTWHIFGNQAGTGITINLQHNTATNQGIFSNTSHYVTRWGSASPNNTGNNASSTAWQSNTLGSGATGNQITPAGTLAGSNMRNRAYSNLVTTAAAAETYFTKSSSSSTPLSVTLIDFTAKPKDCSILLNWNVAAESNLEAYYLQKSANGQAFRTIATIVPKGDNSSYQYTDLKAINGKNIYRLTMTEKNGKLNVSPTIDANFDCLNGKSVSIYPNPFTNGLLNIKDMQGDNTIRVLNIYGQVLQQISVKETNTTLDLSRLPAATYIIQLIQENEIKLNERVIKL